MGRGGTARLGELFALESRPLNPWVETEGVAANHGADVVFSDVNWTIERGSRWALLGPSGSGKSTLLRLLAGLETPAAGKIVIDGRTASSAGRVEIPPHERGLAMVFQDLALWPNLTASENVELGLSGARLSREELKRRIREALESCRIAQLAERRPQALSGGEQQRLALARALAMRPRLLLLDEPFSGLDIDVRDLLFLEIERLIEELGCALVLVSHDPWEAATLCSSALVLEGGMTIESGAFTDLLTSPSSKTLRSFVEHQSAFQRQLTEEQA